MGHALIALLLQGRNHGWKVEEDQGLGPNTGALAPRARPRPGWMLGAGGGRPLPLWGSGVSPPSPRKICENSDAKFCILVTTCCKIGCFLKTTAKKLRKTSTLLVPNLKFEGPVSPSPYGCCAYVPLDPPMSRCCVFFFSFCSVGISPK